MKSHRKAIETTKQDAIDLMPEPELQLYSTLSTCVEAVDAQQQLKSKEKQKGMILKKISHRNVP